MNSKRLTTWILGIALLIGSGAGQLYAQTAGELIDKLPRAAEDIGVDDKTGDWLELDLVFDDDKDRQINLKDYFDGKRPVMLSFNYSNCPKLCSVQWENMVSTLREIDFEVNTDFQVISISIDPQEQASRAKKTKALYLKYYNRSETADGWHFLTGDRDSIEFAADNCGFRYKYIPRQKLYSHPPVFILLSPKGKIVRYIHGLDYDVKTMERALIESAEGKIGSPINQLSYGLGCFLFDETTGKYSFQVMGLMRIGGAITVIVLLVSLIPFWFFKRGRNSDDTDEMNKTTDLEKALDASGA